MTDLDLTGYPAPQPDTYRGRPAWPMGEDGDQGVLIAGHGVGAWMSLFLYCHDLGIDSPRWAPGNRPRERWATFRQTCGCTDTEHLEHQQRLDAYDEADHPTGPPLESCSDLTNNDDCDVLPPCGDTFAWTCRWHDDPTTRPADALPVLEWAT